jgi:hypothetical protein
MRQRRLVGGDEFLISWPPQPHGDLMFLDHPTISATDCQIHDHKGTVIVFWHETPNAAEQACWTLAVVHEF